MNTTGRFCCALVVGLFSWSTAGAEDTLDSVEKKIVAQADKNKTLAAKMVVTTQIDGENMKMSSKGEGFYEYARRGEKVLFRSETKSNSTSKFGDGPENKTQEKSLLVGDGQFIYMLSENGGQKTAMKMKQDPARSNVTDKSMFEFWRKQGELKLLPDEKIDGKDVYVIRATPKKPQPNTTEQQTYYFAKDSGLLMKSISESKGPQGKSSVTYVLSEVKLNPDLKPDRFVFKAPDGVEVTDMTAGAGATTEPAEQAAGEAKEISAPESEKKTEEPKPEAERKEPRKRGVPLPRIRNPLK